MSECFGDDVRRVLESLLGRPISPSTGDMESLLLTDPEAYNKAILLRELYRRTVLSREGGQTMTGFSDDDVYTVEGVLAQRIMSTFNRFNNTVDPKNMLLLRGKMEGLVEAYDDLVSKTGIKPRIDVTDYRI